jgi:hypothetical protein
MIWWAAAAGALIGWSTSYFGMFGLVLGGMLGAALGIWLRSEVRREVRDAVSNTLAGQQAPRPEHWDGAGVAVEPKNLPARSATGSWAATPS